MLGQQQEQPLELAVPPEQKTLFSSTPNPQGVFLVPVLSLELVPPNRILFGEGPVKKHPVQNKPYLRSWSSKRLWSSQPRINMGVLHINLMTQKNKKWPLKEFEHCADLGVEAVCLDSRLLFQYLHHKNSIEAMELIRHVYV